MERQKRYEVALLIIYLVATLVVGTNAEGDSCRMGQRYPGEMVNIAQAKENAKQDNGIVTVPKGCNVIIYLLSRTWEVVGQYSKQQGSCIKHLATKQKYLYEN